jgi:transcriptional regulator with XRE-family HTH domain
MLLQEVHWKEHAGKVLVIGQVNLWGNVIEFERGWRAQFAYPSQLYALTDDELLAMTLRERYQIPVAWGHQAEALGRVLPPGLRWRSASRDDESPTEMPVVPIAAPVVIDMVHAQEADELAEARKLLTLERERVEKLRELLAVDRQRLREEHKAAKLERKRLAVEQERVAERMAEAARRPRHASPNYGPQSALKEQLQERGITQATLAGYAGVSRTMVVNLLAGRCTSARIHEAAQRLLNLGARLDKLGWSQNELARRIGKDPGLVSRVVRGEVVSSPVWEAVERVLATEGQKREADEHSQSPRFRHP